MDWLRQRSERWLRGLLQQYVIGNFSLDLSKGGEFELSSLQLRPDAVGLDGFVMEDGFIGTMQLELSFMTILSRATRLKLRNVRLRLRAQQTYDEGTLEKMAAARLEQVRSRLSADPAGDDDLPDRMRRPGMLSRLAMRVLMNVELSIEQVHLQVLPAKGASSCTAGLRLSSLRFITTDAHGSAGFDDDDDSVVYKALELCGLGCYCDVSPRTDGAGNEQRVLGGSSVQATSELSDRHAAALAAASRGSNTLGLQLPQEDLVHRWWHAADGGHQWLLAPLTTSAQLRLDFSFLHNHHKHHHHKHAASPHRSTEPGGAAVRLHLSCSPLVIAASAPQVQQLRALADVLQLGDQQRHATRCAARRRLGMPPPTAARARSWKRAQQAAVADDATQAEYLQLRRRAERGDAVLSQAQQQTLHDLTITAPFHVLLAAHRRMLETAHAAPEAAEESDTTAAQRSRKSARRLLRHFVSQGKLDEGNSSSSSSSDSDSDSDSSDSDSENGAVADAGAGAAGAAARTTAERSSASKGRRPRRRGVYRVMSMVRDRGVTVRAWVPNIACSLLQPLPAAGAPTTAWMEAARLVLGGLSFSASTGVAAGSGVLPAPSSEHDETGGDEAGVHDDASQPGVAGEGHRRTYTCELALHSLHLHDGTVAGAATEVPSFPCVISSSSQLERLAAGHALGGGGIAERPMHRPPAPPQSMVQSAKSSWFSSMFNCTRCPCSGCSG